MSRTLDRRTLNRTLLTRQMLVDRSQMTALAAVEHLVAVQAQERGWPYLGLWTRLRAFRHEDLTALISDGSVVRSTMIRRTQHLALGADFTWLRPTVAPIVARALKAAYYADEIKGLDLDELAGAGREVLAGRSLKRRELAELLSERFPGRHRNRLAEVIEVLEPLAYEWGGNGWGGWGTSGGIPLRLASEWIGRPMETKPSPKKLILRYLAAFGPAGVMDIQAWAGVTRLREVVQEMGSQLRVYRDENGKELFDLPQASLAESDLPAPVRFLPAYDNYILGHADRTRIISDADRKRVMPGRALVLPTFTVDGFVHGVWSLQDTTLTISPFRSLSASDEADLLAEADRLLHFLPPNEAATDRRVVLTPPQLPRPAPSPSLSPKTVKPRPSFLESPQTFKSNRAVFLESLGTFKKKLLAVSASLSRTLDKAWGLSRDWRKHRAMEAGWAGKHRGRGVAGPGPPDLVGWRVG